MWSNSGSGAYSPTGLEEEAAIQAASDAGALGISFYDLHTLTPNQAAVIAGMSYPANPLLG